MAVALAAVDVGGDLDRRCVRVEGERQRGPVCAAGAAAFGWCDRTDRQPDQPDHQTHITFHHNHNANWQIGKFISRLAVTVTPQKEPKL